MSVVAYPQPTPVLVIFGRDQGGKPHASWFDQASAELATKAAALMNMRAVKVEGETLAEIASSLPKGRVFTSGRAFSPFINAKLYGRLIEATRDMLGLSTVETGEQENEDSAVSSEQTVAEETGAEAPRPEPQQPAKPAASKRPTRIEEVGLGSIVLATTGPTEGWFECEVIGINGGMLTLRWCDYVEPAVTRRPNELGFLPARAA